ncbi:MAG: hypothetical protein IH609_16205 [Dehalococcoidia bacterium]|nr:hypothetical protein [Dehalococcoidia bacterium]
MRVYVESNFVLELVFSQEQVQSCESLLTLAERSEIELTIPAFSVMEPYQRIVRRKRDRDELQSKLEKERAEVARVSAYRDPAGQLEQIASFLIASSDRDRARMSEIRERILASSRVTPLDALVLQGASILAERFGLSPEDAVVLESVRTDLVRSVTADAVFLTKNSKDFRDPEISEFLGCRVFFDFDGGLAAIQSSVRPRPLR